MINHLNFAILHTFSETQVLINTDFDHEKDEFILLIKFWSKGVNGYVTLEMRYSTDKEDIFNEIFEKWKDPEHCETEVQKFINFG
jgi:hypothetical protein